MNKTSTLLFSILFVFAHLALSNPLASQELLSEKDIHLIENKTLAEAEHIHYHDISFMRSRSDNFLVRNNPVVLLFGGMMYIYQAFISPQLPSECLYHVSCSTFSIELIEEFGLFKGVFTTSDRLMRCNRISALDVHPLMINEQSGRVDESVEIYQSR